MRPPGAARRCCATGCGASLAGYWTHGGYLNWDTGLGFYALAPAQEGRAGAAGADRRRGRSRELQPGPRVGRVGEVDARPRPASRTPRSSSASGGSRRRSPTASTPCRESRGNAYLAAARAEANAMRALDAGLGARAPRAARRRCTRSTPTPAALAVTTPAYNTAIIAVNQRAIPYGGLDIARLFDGGQEVAANIGGVRPRGLRPDRAPRRHVLATQYGDRRYAAGATPLRLTRAPRGVGAGAARAARLRGPVHRPARARAGRARRGARHDRYRFTPRLHRGALDAARAAAAWPRRDVPELGPRRARASPRCATGATVALGRAPLALARVRVAARDQRAQRLPRRAAARAAGATCGSSRRARSRRIRTRADGRGAAGGRADRGAFGRG